MIDLLIMLYIVFGSIIVIKEVLYMVNVQDICIISGFRLMYAFIYGFVPACVLIMHNNGMDTGAYVQYDNETTLFAMYIFAVISYIFLNLGYAIKLKNAPMMNIEDSPVDYGSSYEKLDTLAVLLTIISFISLFIWSYAYGGPSKMMVYASYIRSGYDTTKNSLAFFKSFTSTNTMAAYLCFASLIFNDSKISKKVGLIILLAINIYTKTMYSLIDDGRMTAVMFFVGFLAIFYYEKYSRGAVKLGAIARKFAVVALIAYFLMVFASYIMDTIRLNTSNVSFSDFNFLSSIIKEFRYTFSDLYTSINKRWEGCEHTFFRNVISGLFAYLPTSLKPVYARTNLTKINSIFVYGEVYAQHSGSPPDFISVALYDIGFIGIIIYPILVGMLVRKLDNYFLTYKRTSIYGLIVYVCLIFRISRIVANASMYNFMMSIFYIVFSSILLWLLNHISIGGTKK